MGDHSSRTLLHKLVLIISFLLLWQFGCGFRARITGLRRPSSSFPGGAYRTCGPGTPYGPCVTMPPPSNCSTNQGLPCEEAEALQSFLEALGVTLASSITPSYCNETESYDSINITCKRSEKGNLYHITEIVSYSNSLNGHIDEDVSQLGWLEKLDLSISQLGGSIPDSLGTLSNLTILNLRGNQLTGSIPDTLGDLMKLTSLDLSSNQLSGSIPHSLANLPNLTYFDLSSNQLSGSIPRSLANLPNLTYLDLAFNQLTGGIPEQLKNLQKLTTLYLYRNFLTGKIPTSLGELSSLLILYLYGNKLEGKIPDELGKLTKLRELSLSENNLTGPLPESLGELRNLQYFWLNSNNFTGNLPQNYSKLTSLVEFAVAGNSLSGRIPSYFRNWDNLTSLMLLGNNFEGPLPHDILQMTKLQYLRVSDLNNSGFPIPENANLTNIVSLTLRNCSINGTIPLNVWNWTWLSYLDLSFNMLTGEIPKSLNYTNLGEMYLTGNMLSGVVPDWIKDERLDKADLSYNNFTNVTFPDNQTNRALNSTDVINIEPNRDSIGNMSNGHCQNGKSKYHSLFINCGGEEANINGTQYEADENLSSFYWSNKTNWAYTCSGDFLASSYNSSDYIKNLTCGVSVPDEALYKKARLCPVSLKYHGFCLHKGNYTVKLHFAEILYTENADYSSLGKRIFDVYVQGERVLKDFNIEEKAGGPNKVSVQNITTLVNDDNLLTIHFFWAGKGSMYNPPELNGPLISAISVTPNFKVGGGGLSTWKIVVITIASILAPLLLLALLWRMGLIGDRELRESRVRLRDKSYTIKQIIDATRKFSPEMEIGRERFGIVYKAELPDKVVVAVKKLSPQSKHVIDQIRSEVDAEKEKPVIDQIRSEVDAEKEKFSPQLKQIIDQIRSEVDAQKEKLSPQSKQVIDQIIDQSEVNAQKKKLSPQSKQAIDQIRSEVDVQKEYKHENLVELLDGYSKKDLRLMIYEYVEHTLFDPKSKIELSWENRCDICLGMAEGLKYLHERTPMVIHGSIKPSNILLDGRLKAKISDIPYTFIDKEGPNIYTAPEHATRADHITDKVDVYSFGLVLLELISGKKSEAENLADWACSNLQEFVDNKLEFVDNRLPRTFNPEQAKNILKLAVTCVNISPALRPTMSEVVNQLRCNASILHNLRIRE